MSKNEDILKKILLHMKYDSKKTLSENRLLVEEDCIPLNTLLSNIVSGETRSTTYPELGRWGDGRCMCKENTKCLEYKPECCPKLKVTAEQNVFFETAADGRVLELPSTAKILSRFSANDWALESIEDFGNRNNGIFKLACETNKPLIDGFKEYNLRDCLNGYKNKYVNNIKDKSVFSFTANGKKYSSCYVIREVVGGTNKYLNSDKLKVHTGYGSPCSENVMWDKYKTEDGNGIKKSEQIDGSEAEVYKSGNNTDKYSPTSKFKSDEGGKESFTFYLGL